MRELFQDGAFRVHLEMLPNVPSLPVHGIDLGRSWMFESTIPITHLQTGVSTTAVFERLPGSSEWRFRKGSVDQALFAKNLAVFRASQTASKEEASLGPAAQALLRRIERGEDITKPPTPSVT